MLFPESLVKASFIERANRFACWVEIEGKIEKAHLANSGRLKELLNPGRLVYLVEAHSPPACPDQVGVKPRAFGQRRTRYDMLLAALDSLLVSVDARLPNALVEEGIKLGILTPFHRYPNIRREVKFGHSRLDFLLQRDSQLCYLEAKSITLVEKGRGLFPDAPTLRGRQHLLSLIQARREGHQAAIVFVVQRPDVAGFSPNDATDPAFGAAIRQAREAGVGIYAYRCQVSFKEIHIEAEIPVYI